MEFRRVLFRSVAFVTGGGSGIVEAVVRMLASHGCDVLVGDLRVEEGKFAGLEGRVTPLIVDVRDPGSVERAMTQLKDQFGRLDYLVNCAGTTLSGETATLPLAEDRKRPRLNASH